MAEKWFATTVVFAEACTWSATSPPTVIPRSISIKCFIYAQSCHLLVVNSYCVPQNTHNMYMMWHSIKYTYQSKDSMKIALSAPLLSALGRARSLKLFTGFLLILHILWAGFVAKNQNSKRRAYTLSLSHKCLKCEHFSWFVPRIFYQILGNSKGFQPSSLEWTQVPFFMPSLPTSSLFLWAQQGGQQLVGLPDNKWKLWGKFALQERLCQPLQGFQSLQPCNNFQSDYFHKKLLRKLFHFCSSQFLVWKLQRINISALLR